MQDSAGGRDAAEIAADKRVRDVYLGGDAWLRRCSFRRARGYGQTVVPRTCRLRCPSAAPAVLGRNGVGKTTLLATIMGHTTFHWEKWVSREGSGTHV